MDDALEVNDYLSAAEVGNIGFVRNWIRKGRDPDEQKEENGVTALMAALIHDQKAIVQLLLGPTVKSNVILCDNNGWTPLHYALLHAGRSDYPTKFYVELLIQNASDVNARISADDPRPEFRLQAPLHLAAKAKNFEICKILYEAGARFDFRDQRGLVPFDENICGLEFRRRLVEELKLPALSQPTSTLIPQQFPLGHGAADLELGEILKHEPEGAKQKSKFFRNQITIAYNKINEQRLIIEAYQREDRKTDMQEARKEKAGVGHLRKMLDAKEKHIETLMAQLHQGAVREEELYQRLVLSKGESARLMGKASHLEQEVVRLTPHGKKTQARTQPEPSKRPAEEESSAEDARPSKRARISEDSKEGELEVRESDVEDDLESIPTDGYTTVPPPAGRKLYGAAAAAPAEKVAVTLRSRTPKPAASKQSDDRGVKLTQLMATPVVKSPQATYSKRQKRTARGPASPVAPSQVNRRVAAASDSDSGEAMDVASPEIDGEEYHSAMRMLLEDTEQPAPSQKRSFFTVPKKSQNKL